MFQENYGTVIYKIIGDSDYYRKGEGCSILSWATQPKGTGNLVIERDLRWRLEINDEDRSEFIKLQMLSTGMIYS